MLTHVGTNIIETERLILRKFEYTDDETMLKNWIADEKIQSLYSEPVYSTKEAVKGLLDKYISSYKCLFYDEKKMIMDAVEAADVFIFTTPTYCMRASAPMKSFMDLTFTYWVSHRPRKCMYYKRAVVVSTAAGVGAKSAVKDIANTLFYWGVPYVKSYGIAVQAMNWNGVSTKKKDKIESTTSKLARALSKDKKPTVGIKTRFFFKVMGMMQKAGMGSSPVEKEYWEQNGWLAKERPWR